MRDLGGIRTMDGKQIRPGLLVRSASLFQAEEQDLRGISAVIDLRTSAEREESPDRAWGRQYLLLPVFEEATAGISRESSGRDRGIPDMAFLYGKMMRECAESFRKIILAVMEHDFGTGAVLWHCTEGKDRCGMTAAIVLEALGVSRERILEDYLKTNEVNLPKALRIREQLAATHGEAFAARVYQAYIADERYLRAAWDAMGTDYLRETLRIGDPLLEAFRETVLRD